MKEYYDTPGPWADARKNGKFGYKAIIVHQLNKTSDGYTPGRTETVGPSGKPPPIRKFTTRSTGNFDDKGEAIQCAQSVIDKRKKWQDDFEAKHNI